MWGQTEQGNVNMEKRGGCTAAPLAFCKDVSMHLPLSVLELDGMTPDEAKCFLEEMRRHRAANLTWRAAVQGNVVRVYRIGCPAPETNRKGKKPIGVWTHQSRMKLLRFLNKIDYSKIGSSLFVTLTYPDHVRREEYRLRSRDRYVFLRSLESYLGCHAACVWRIEWEERKSGAYTGMLAPHFHLMIFGVPFLPWQKVREWWRQAIGAGEGPLVTDVKRIYNENGACRYLSKYVSKYLPLDIGVYHNSGLQFGRHWGVTRKELIPLCPIAAERQLTDDEIKIVRKFAAARWTHYNAESGGGYTVLGEKLAKSFTAFLKRS